MDERSENGRRVRHALPSELDAVYGISHTAWGEGKGFSDYLEECRNSPKYAKGAWFVLSDREMNLYSSLITYRYPAGAYESYGIGSVATRPENRKKGFASELLRGVLARFDEQGMTRSFLYSDIDPEFYGRLGYVALPESFQKKPGSVVMGRGFSASEIADPDFFVPGYF